ncbi:MAG: hypothetical protein KGL31_05610 [candidate division NC10 bacterium]|nr:hypothetical protein [candidate division NC10 bacterium]MDE2321380.1 hypothetical protein [candidate division NC10 bacterium]
MSITELLQAISARYLGAVYAFGSRATEVTDRVRGKSTTQQSPEWDIDIGYSLSRVSAP